MYAKTLTLVSQDSMAHEWQATTHGGHQVTLRWHPVMLASGFHPQGNDLIDHLVDFVAGNSSNWASVFTYEGRYYADFCLMAANGFVASGGGRAKWIPLGSTGYWQMLPDGQDF